MVAFAYFCVPARFVTPLVVVQASAAKGVILATAESFTKCYLENGRRMPNTMAEVMEKSYYPRDITDPYERGTPLKYVRLSDTKGYVYSVGPDGKDDKATIVVTMRDIRTHDLRSSPWRATILLQHVFESSRFGRPLQGDIVGVFDMEGDIYFLGEEQY